MLFGLSAVVLAVLILPFCVKKIEHNVEVFLFAMGIVSCFISSQWSVDLVKEGLREPILISLAVFAFGMLFKKLRRTLDKAIQQALKILPLPIFVFLLIILLGLASSIITAIVAALVLVEVVALLPLDKKFETKIVIIACFAIGLGAALTPVGEPLATIAIAKLKSWPHVDFWFLFHLIGWEVTAAIVALALFSFFLHGRKSGKSLKAEHREESVAEISWRAGKVYLFVMALIFLGQGFKPMIDQIVTPLSGEILYWINTISAILDNATLTAAEISTAMNPVQIKKLLMGLLIAGGMLIPGNIPNIIAASKLKISSKEWARLGLPLGFILMLIFFFILESE